MDCSGLCMQPRHFVVGTCSERWWHSPDLGRVQHSAPSPPSSQGRPPQLLQHPREQLMSNKGDSVSRVSLAPWLPLADTWRHLRSAQGVGVSLGDTGQARGCLPCSSLLFSPVPAPAPAPAAPCPSVCLSGRCTPSWSRGKVCLCTVGAHHGGAALPPHPGGLRTAPVVPNLLAPRWLVVYSLAGR